MDSVRTAQLTLAQNVELHCPNLSRGGNSVTGMVLPPGSHSGYTAENFLESSGSDDRLFFVCKGGVLYGVSAIWISRQEGVELVEH